MEERLRELSAALDNWLVGDWVFRKESPSYEAASAMNKVYLNVIETMQSNNAVQHTIYLMISGVVAGKSYEQIIEDSKNAKSIKAPKA